MASTDAKPFPQKNIAYRVTFPIRDADGDLVTGATGLDSEVSKDGGPFADCTNEATEIAPSSGVYYLDLTWGEMDADTVVIIVKTSSSGAKTTTLVMYPEEPGDIRANVVAFGGTLGAFASGRPEVNTSHIAGSAVSTSSAQIGVNVVNAAGTAWNSGAITANTFAAGAVTASALASDAVAEINATVDQALSDYDAPTHAELVSEINDVQADIAALENLSAAQVNAEMVDVLTVDTYPEPGQGAPAATASLKDKLGYLFKAWRNKTTQTNCDYRLFADDDSTIDQRAGTSDDGATFTRAKISSGP
ncbi:MAG: hypothetical protein AB7S74_18760 [Hyphomicrobium sp.]